MIGKFQHLWNRPVVRLDFKSFRFRVTLCEIQDVLEVSSSPRVDRLGVIAYNHKVPMFFSKNVDHLGLHPVGVLIFINKNKLELRLVDGCYI